MTIDEMKRADLVTVLSAAWGMSFERSGSGFVALSPFTAEQRPSFCAALVDDAHWVYCDHSDGSSGSIIDLAMRKLGTRDAGRACDEARRLIRQAGVAPAPAAAPAAAPSRPAADPGWLYERLRSVDAGPCREYLTGRGVDETLVNGLIERGMIVLNTNDGSRYCCFAVRAADGGLQALFNRRIDGPSERAMFLLGRQHPFCPDWDAAGRSPALYVCESIIDALSLLTLRPDACAVALSGANADPGALQPAPGARLIEAFDADPAGRKAAARLAESFPGHRVESFDLCGCGDLNEYLTTRPWMSDAAGGTAKLSVRDRIAVALSDRPSRELAAEYGIHHSRVCDIRNDAEAVLSEIWESRRPGRRARPKPPPELAEKDRKLQQVQRELDLTTMRKEWLELQLEFHEKRDAEVETEQVRRKRKKKVRKKGRKC